MFKNRQTKTLTLAEYEVQQAQARRLETLKDLAEAAARQADSKAWDDPKTWK